MGFPDKSDRHPTLFALLQALGQESNLLGILYVRREGMNRNALLDVLRGDTQRLEALLNAGWLVQRGETLLLSSSLQKGLANLLLNDPTEMLSEWEAAFEKVREELTQHSSSHASMQALEHISERVCHLPIWLHPLSRQPWQSLQQKALQLSKAMQEELGKIAALIPQLDRATEESWTRTQDILARLPVLTQDPQAPDAYDHLLALKQMKQGPEWASLLGSHFAKDETAPLLLAGPLNLSPQPDPHQVAVFAPGKRKALPSTQAPTTPSISLETETVIDLASLWEAFSQQNQDLLNFLRAQLGETASDTLSQTFFQLLSIKRDQLEWGAPTLSWQGHLWPEVHYSG